MAFLDQIGKKITQTGQSAVKKTKEMAEIAKINSMISDEEKNINNYYYQIGKLYVSLHGADCESDYRGIVDSIFESEKKIADFREQLQIIKGVVRCEKCGGEVSINSAFCNSCGAPMPKRIIAQTDTDTIKCSNCGSPVKKGMRFCTSCGNPMQQCTEESQTINEEEKTVEIILKKCPNCGGESTDPEVFFCNECGTKMIVMQQEDSSTAENTDVQAKKRMKRCPNCGFECDDSDIDFCTECGTKLV